MGSGESSAVTVGVARPCQFLAQCQTKKLHLTKPRLKDGVDIIRLYIYHLLGLSFVEA